MGRRVDLVSMLEAAYDVTKESDAEWLRGIVDASAPQIDRGLGVLTFLYDATDSANMRIVSDTVMGGTPPPGMNAGVVRDVVAGFPPEMIDATFRALPCALGRPTTGGPIEFIWKRFFEPIGVEDFFIVNGIDPTGHGCYLGAMLPKQERLARATQRRWAMVASHLATAYRLRRRLRGRASPTRPAVDGTEAILKPTGSVAHAEAPAQADGALANLREAVRGIERARGRLRKADDAAALEGWQGLVTARWTLVDHFETDGQRYILARRNDPEPTALDELTLRERQAVAYAALGHTNKLIAYEMGISASTVGVLLHRAAARLGTTTRDELVAKFGGRSRR